MFLKFSQAANMGFVILAVEGDMAINANKGRVATTAQRMLFDLVLLQSGIAAVANERDHKVESNDNYIRQIKQSREYMKTKKKPTSQHKKSIKKPVPLKHLLLIDKTIATTKEKTHATIQSNFQNNDGARSFRPIKITTPRLADIEKMEEHNISPFSSQGGSSKSPIPKNLFSPKHKKSSINKKIKQKLAGNPLKKSKTPPKIESRPPKMMTKQESNQLAYENLLIKKINEKKITELSEQSQLSIRKFNKNVFRLNINQGKLFKKSKHEIVRQKRLQYQNTYRTEYPDWSEREIKFNALIAVIQFLWRQKKAKSIISQYISPRNQITHTQSIYTHNQSNISNDNQSNIETTNLTQQNTQELIKKHQNQQQNRSFEKEIHSTELNQESDKKEIFKDLEISEQISSPQKDMKMLKFITCYRQITFKNHQNKKKTKPNIFNLAQSLSQKCLMQKFYSKIFKNSTNKLSNFDIFNNKSQQRSRQLISIIKSPQKNEIVEIQQRFYTQTQQQSNKLEQIQEQTIQKKKEIESQLYTIKNLNFVSQDIISFLLSEFSEQFTAFTQKTLLKKKKTNRLPGITINQTSIREYLQGIKSYLLKKYQPDVIKRFGKMNSSSFLKIYHTFDQDCSEIEEDEQQCELNLPIIPNNIFYEYQCMYEAEKFVISEQNKKYSNFLESLIKIHNLSLVNCFSEWLQKYRIDRMVHPWDREFEPRRVTTEEILQKQLDLIINRICKHSFQKIGLLHRKNQAIEQEKLLKSIHEEYVSQGNDWKTQDQLLQIRIELTDFVYQALIEQVCTDLAM